MSNFYNNLVSGKYNTYEKVASTEDEAVRETLSELTQEQIDVLTGELEGITKRASEMSLEDTLSYEFEEAIERTAAEECTGEESKKESKEDDKKDDSKKQDAKEKEAEEDEDIEQNASEEELSELEKEMEVEASEGDDDSKEEKEEDKEEKKDGDDDNDDDSQQSVPTDKTQVKEKCAEEEEISFEKLSAEEQFEITKQACEEVEHTLAEAGYTLADYVYSLTGLEKHAHEIAEQAEKLASIHDIPAVMATNHILNAMNEILDAE